MTKKNFCLICIFFVLIIPLIYAAEIDSCQTLTEPNSLYALNQNIFQPLDEDCIVIAAENITIDCQGYSITSSSKSGNAGIYSNRVNTTIKNCKVSMGVYSPGIELLSANNSYIFNNTLNHQYIGIFLTDVHHALIENNIANFNGFIGVYLTTDWGSSSQNTLIGNTANNNYYGIEILHSTSNTLIENTANNNSNTGISIGSSLNNNLIRNTADNNEYGIILGSSSDNTVKENNANKNSKYGIFVFRSSLNNNLRGNKFCFNSDKDVYCADNQTFINNWCDISGNVCGGTCLLCSEYRDRCIDGTANGDCSIANPPLYCDFRYLVFDPNKCGANAGKCCQSVKNPTQWGFWFPEKHDATSLAVNVPYIEDCSNVWTYFDEMVIWRNKSFYEKPGIATVIGGYPTAVVCQETPFDVKPPRPRAGRPPKLNHGVRYKTDSCIFVPWSDDPETGDRQKQVAILDWNYSADSYCVYNGSNVVVKEITYLNCTDLGGDICSANEYCPGTDLTAADSDRCCSVNCEIPSWPSCSQCGEGLFNTCDRDECRSIVEGCYFVDDPLFIHDDCKSCSGASCLDYNGDFRSCSEDICGFGNCIWNSSLGVCDMIFNCSDIAHCGSYTGYSSGECGADPCNVGPCFYDGAECREDICTDSDNVDYGVKGSCFDGVVYTKPINDSCSGNVLTEYYCDPHYCAIYSYYCSLEGKICQDGKCVIPSYQTIEIDSCQKIGQSDTTYILNQSIINNNLTEACISIYGENVVLDCQGHSIISGSNESGVASYKKNTVIKNCNINMGNGLGGRGIYLQGADNSYIYNNTLIGNGVGVYAWSVTNVQIINNSIKNSSGDGIRLLSDSNNNVLTGNTVDNSFQYGIYINSGSDNILTNNNVSYSAMGIYMSDSNNNVLTNNIVNNNGIYGIDIVGSDNTLTSNIANSNSQNGIRISGSENNIINNNANYNSDGILIISGLYNILTGNMATNNDWAGIHIAYSNYNNIANNNANSNRIGIRLYSNSNNTLTGNTANNNSEYGFYLSLSSDNTLTNNIANNNSLYGIFIPSSSLNNDMQRNEFCYNTVYDAFCYNAQSLFDNKCGVNNGCGGSCVSCQTQIETFNIILYPGWNLISLPLIPTNPSIEAVMQGCDYNRIWEFQPDQTWKWTPSDLTTMNISNGYWIDRVGLSGNCEITVGGTMPYVTTMNVYSPWTLVGYPSLTPRLIVDIVPGTLYNRIWEFQPDQTWKWTPYDLVSMQPGRGYWVDSSATGSYEVTY